MLEIQGCPAPQLIAALAALPETLELFCTPTLIQLYGKFFHFQTVAETQEIFSQVAVQDLLDVQTHAQHRRVLSAEVQNIVCLVQDLLRTFSAPQLLQRGHPKPYIRAQRQPGIVLLTIDTSVPWNHGTLLGITRSMVWPHATRPATTDIEHLLSVSRVTPWIDCPTTAHARAVLARTFPVMFAFFNAYPSAGQGRIVEMDRTMAVFGRQANNSTYPIVVWAVAQQPDAAASIVR